MALIYLTIIALCCIVIWRASDGFETASEYLGRNLSEGVRGATINAIGSSVPELLTTFFFLFAVKDTDGFAGGIGTTAGSAVFNGVIIPSLVALIVIGFGIAKSIQPSRKVILRDGIALILCEFVLIMLISGDTLYWWHGMVLMLMYVIYIVYMFSSMKKKEEGAEEEEEDDEEEEEENAPFLKSLLTLNLAGLFVRGRQLNGKIGWTLLLVATAILGVSCYFLVEACEGLGEAFGIPVYFVAVILAAAATSVPDTFISIRDGMKGNYDDAISNALGSNIFDICFALGLPLFLYTIIYEPITMSPETIANTSELRAFLLFSTIGAFGIFLIRRKMGIIKSVLLFSIYIIFLIYVIGRANGWESLEGISNWLQDFVHTVSLKL